MPTPETTPEKLDKTITFDDGIQPAELAGWQVAVVCELKEDAAGNVVLCPVFNYHVQRSGRGLAMTVVP